MSTTPRVRRSALDTMTVLALALTGLAMGGPASAAAPENDTVVIHTVKDPNLVLDMAGGSANPGTRVVLYGAHGGANQKWEMAPVQGDWSGSRTVTSSPWSTSTAASAWTRPEAASR
ncbi:RICIN domain-containing protein [Streptomyces sp. RTd22]|uniref:RICIN domain-containing protein n=1 Tax=Streptomyces sp. RTd22 TaxID=1841249 RepID=UPI0007C4752D|nr:RICIN domain-containing protein [Streptomyces sp. RTd22]